MKKYKMFHVKSFSILKWNLLNLTLSWCWIGIKLRNALFDSSFGMIFFNFWLAHITIQWVKLVRSWIRRTFAIRTDSSETVANKMILNFHRRIRTSWLVVNSTEITVIVFRKDLFRISEVRTQNCFILVWFVSIFVSALANVCLQIQRNLLQGARL